MGSGEVTKGGVGKTPAETLGVGSGEVTKGGVGKTTTETHSFLHEQADVVAGDGAAVERGGVVNVLHDGEMQSLRDGCQSSREVWHSRERHLQREEGGGFLSPKKPFTSCYYHTCIYMFLNER